MREPKGSPQLMLRIALLLATLALASYYTLPNFFLIRNHKLKGYKDFFQEIHSHA